MASRINIVEKIAAKAWLLKANILTGLEQYELALKCYDRVLRIDPNCREAIVNNAMALCRLAEANEADGSVALWVRIRSQKKKAAEEQFLTYEEALEALSASLDPVCYYRPIRRNAGYS